LRESEDSTASETFLDQLLNFLLSYETTPATLVFYYYNFITRNNCSANADKYLLFSSQLVTITSKSVVDALTIADLFSIKVKFRVKPFYNLRCTFKEIIQSSFQEKALYFLVRNAASRVNIELNGSVKDHRPVIDDSDTRTQGMQVNFTNIYSINKDTARLKLKDARESIEQRRNITGILYNYSYSSPLFHFKT